MTHRGEINIQRESKLGLKRDRIEYPDEIDIESREPQSEPVAAQI